MNKNKSKTSIGENWRSTGLSVVLLSNTQSVRLSVSQSVSLSVCLSVSQFSENEIYDYEIYCWVQNRIAW